MTIIPEQFNEGYKHGKADARIVSREGKLNRYMNVNNLNHEHDDFIMGYSLGFAHQKMLMEAES